MNIEEINKLYPGYDTIYGPFSRKEDNRKHVILYDTIQNCRKTISFSKLLLELKLGRKLEENETCDHIDEDTTNDNPNNLQVLSRVDNAKKSAPKAKVKVCKCEKEFLPKYKEQKYCSNQCRWDYTETHK